MTTARPTTAAQAWQPRAAGAGALAGQAGATDGGGGGATAGAAGTATAGSGGVVNTPKTCDKPRTGSPMVELPSPEGISYCMDVRPTRQAEYQTFLDAKKGDMSGQDDKCADNKTYEVFQMKPGSSGSAGCPMGTFTPDKTPDFVVTCVDYCDAAAYCKWAGKRLCGKIGGGNYSLDEAMKGLHGEWSNACSQGGVVDMAAKSGQLPPFDQLLYIGSPAMEWIDGCTTGALPAQPTLTFCAMTPQTGRCHELSTMNVIGTDEVRSFRCCAE